MDLNFYPPVLRISCAYWLASQEYGGWEEREKMFSSKMRPESCVREYFIIWSHTSSLQSFYTISRIYSPYMSERVTQRSEGNLSRKKTIWLQNLRMMPDSGHGNQCPKFPPTKTAASPKSLLHIHSPYNQRGQEHFLTIFLPMDFLTLFAHSQEIVQVF